MFRKSSIILGVAGVALTLSCIASAASFFNPNGFYAEGNVGYGQTRVKVDGDSTHNEGVTGSVNFGYGINRYIAIEAGAALFPNVSWYGYRVSSSNYYFDLVAKVIAPLNNQMSVFAKLGGACAHTKYFDEYSYTRGVALFGAGFDYAFTPKLKGVVQLTATSKSGDEVPSMVAGTAGIDIVL